MTAFKPIPPHSAVNLLSEVGVEQGIELIADLAEAGLVKAYARLMERLQPTGARESVRDKRIPQDMWRRIIAEGKVADVLSGTVRLDGSPEFGGGPKITLIGIRFDPDTLRKAADDHGPGAPKAPAMPKPPKVAASDREVVEVAPCLAAPGRAPIPVNAAVVTMDEAAEIIGCGRTKAYELRNAGELDQVKHGRASRITRESIERYLKKGGA